MNKSESIAKLAEALSKAQAEMKGASADSTNPHFKSKYADLSSIWDACRKALTDNGLSVSQFPCDSIEGRAGLETILMHSSGEWISQSASTKIQKDDPQGVGSALTYLRRYALAAVVGVTQDDDDGNSASKKQTTTLKASPSWQRWTQLCAEAGGLGLSVPTLDPAASEQDVINAGKSLREKVDAAKAKQSK